MEGLQPAFFIGTRGHFQKCKSGQIQKTKRAASEALIGKLQAYSNFSSIQFELLEKAGVQSLISSGTPIAGLGNIRSIQIQKPKRATSEAY